MTKVWFITGAGSGIGAGIARAALKAGDRVVATARNLEKVCNALAAVASDNLAIVKLDVTDAGQAKEAVYEAIAKFGGLDVLVNNAAYSLIGHFEEMAVPDIEALFATNFYGAVNTMQAVLPVMRKQRSGHIINVSSVAGAVGLPHCAAYASTKFALEGMSLSVAHEIEPFGIKMTIVEPGFFRTDLLDVNNVRFTAQSIDDYASGGNVEANWMALDGTQQGDPDKLGDVLVKIAAMAKPPKQFLAGTDALDVVVPVLADRMTELRLHEELSRSTDGEY